MNSLVPMQDYVSSLMTVREDPVAVLARTYPEAASNLLHAQLAMERRRMELQKVEARTAMMRSFGNDHRDMVCTWLANRQPGEKNMDIVRDSGSERIPNFFGFGGEGERAWMRTRVRIW